MTETHDMTATQTVTRLTISNVLLRCSDGVAYRTSGLCFTVEPSDVFDIHEAPIEVGPHPYASVSLARRESSSTRDFILMHRVATVADLDQKHALEDWMQWCDEVAAALVGDDNDDEPACVPPWTTQATINAVMYSTGALECTESTAVRVAQVNAMA